MNAICGANNANNQLNVNGTSGDYGNNTRINGNASRVALEFDSHDAPTDCLISYEEWFDWYHESRKHKKNKHSALDFQLNQFERLQRLADSVNAFEYIPKQSTMFMVFKPKKREIIAADFSDRIVHTMFVGKIMPYIDEHLSPHSYSCRLGKGSIRAVYALQDRMRSATHFWKDDAWVFKKDFSGFFMSIGTNLWAGRMEDFIRGNHHGNDKELLLYLNRIIYQSLPQEGCYLATRKSAWADFPKHKSLRGKTDGIGVPIGNLPSQVIGNFVTTEYIHWIESAAGPVAHYTDDTAGCVTDKESWLHCNRMINESAKSEFNLNVNKDKEYLQHWTKGVEFLGFKIKGERILPSDRIVNNLKHKVNVYIKNSERFGMGYVIKTKDSMLSMLNSYYGLLRWANTYNLRREIAGYINCSLYGSVLVADEKCLKFVMKKEYSIMTAYIKKAKTRKKSLIDYSHGRT